MPRVQLHMYSVGMHHWYIHFIIFRWHNQVKYVILKKNYDYNEERTMNATTLNRERLIECRKKLGITKQQAAIRMQLSQPAYLRYESGKRTPSIHVIYYMAHILGTSADYLTGKTDDPTPDCHYIYEAEKPELFSLIDKMKHCDSETQKRLMAYFQIISEQKES